MTNTLFPICAAFTSCLLASLPAQRVDLDFDWKKRKVTVSYGVARFGKHTLAELPTGSDWRMGMNLASTIATDLPLVGEAGIVAPGSYRVSLYRKTEKQLGLLVASSELATGGKAAYFPGALEDLPKPQEKLQLAFTDRVPANTPAGQPAATGKETKGVPTDPVDGKLAKRTALRLSFGPYRIDMPMVAIGSTKATVRGFTAEAFTWPGTLFDGQLAKGLSVPVLTLRAKGGSKTRPKVYNLLVDAKQARFLPAMTAPTDSFGFAGVKGFDAKQILAGSVQWRDAPQPVAALKVSEIKIVKGQLLLAVAVGKRIGAVTVPIPPAK
ncbi:MAG: hypothetical protein KDC87_08415 [Planctomycetes bacterium]|nr:hypothetical protein [Planctomycetota bacterium]MCB9870561.1 hypothetical protein [Planctomycetota bacterium]